MDVKPRAPATSRLAPWAALFAALSGELVHHQVLSDMLHYDCRLGDARVFVLAAAGVLAWMALGAAISWMAIRGEPRDAARRFIANLGMLAGLLLSLAVAWQTFAGFVVPSCPA